MTDKNPVLVEAQGDQPEIVDIGTVASENIALSLNLPAEHAPTIKKAIADEINAMSSHFTLAFADIQTSHEISENALKSEYAIKVAALEAKFKADVAQIKSTFSYVQDNAVAVVATSTLFLLLGALVGYFAR